MFKLCCFVVVILVACAAAAPAPEAVAEPKGKPTVIAAAPLVAAPAVAYTAPLTYSAAYVAPSIYNAGYSAGYTAYSPYTGSLVVL